MLKKNKGVTLLELMIVLVIAGIAFSAAVPSVQGMIARNQVVTQTNSLLMAINLARSEALRVGSAVYVKARDSSDANNEFGPGWCVVIGTPIDCTTGEVVRQFEALTVSTLDSVEDAALVDKTVIEFDSLGALAGTDGLPRQLDLCNANVAGRRIFITPIGRAKSHPPDDLDATRQPDC